ncbi:hemerythrin domain-containing protein [Arhodomonas sp. KWT]|nr:hemerythrin domain-containing protein [Arhodomonas sp. KWT]
MPQHGAIFEVYGRRRARSDGRAFGNTEVKDMKPQIPQPLTTEHQKLHRRLDAALDAGGEIADATRRLIDVMHPHFVREEEIAMPPLGLLGSLSRGEYDPEMDRVLEMTDALGAELPVMLKEHEAIREAAASLSRAAESAGRNDIVDFCADLGVHAATEEEVLYPAALLVGDIVRRRRENDAD